MSDGLTKSEKKRKREVRKEEKSRKKHKEASLHMRENGVIRNLGEQRPVLLSTSGFTLPMELSMNAYVKPRTETSLNGMPSSMQTKTEMLLASSQHPNIDYVGREDAPGSVDSLLNHYIAVYDEKTGKMEIMPARKMTVSALLPSESTGTEDVPAEDSQKSKRESRNALTAEFGSKKAKKSLKNLTENAVASATDREARADIKLDQAATAVLDAVAESTAALPTSKEVEDSALADKPIPRPNLAATSPAEVYPLESLIDADTFKVVGVKKWQEAVGAGKDVQVPSLYVARRLQGIVNSKDVKVTKALRFLLVLIQWHGMVKTSSKVMRTPSKDDAKSTIKDTESMVIDHVYRKFGKMNVMTRYNLDFLRTHICALCLAIDNFRVETYDLRQDLKIEASDIAKYFKELGCKVDIPNEKEIASMKITKAAAKSYKIARLRLPLQFPKPRKVPQKRI